MDLLVALRCFEAVATERSFTAGAQRLGLPQPVASRRIAALETELGVNLLVRSTRSVSTSEHGDLLLPLARELIARADRIGVLFSGGGARFTLAVPRALSVRSRAAIRRGALRGPGDVPGGGAGDDTVNFVEAEPDGRRDALEVGRVDAALLSCAADQAEITVPLGIAHDGSMSARLRLAQLRRPLLQRDVPPQALHLLAEDDVPAIRDPLRDAVFAAGLRPDQLRIGTEPVEALTRVHERGDGIVASAAEATRAGLELADLAGPALSRSYLLAGDIEPTGDPDATDPREALVRRLADGLGGRVLPR